MIKLVSYKLHELKEGFKQCSDSAIKSTARRYPIVRQFEDPQDAKCYVQWKTDSSNESQLLTDRNSLQFRGWHKIIENPRKITWIVWHVACDHFELKVSDIYVEKWKPLNKS